MFWLSACCVMGDYVWNICGVMGEYMWSIFGIMGEFMGEYMWYCTIYVIL